MYIYPYLYLHANIHIYTHIYVYIYIFKYAEKQTNAIKTGEKIAHEWATAREQHFYDDKKRLCPQELDDYESSARFSFMFVYIYTYVYKYVHNYICIRVYIYKCV